MASIEQEWATFMASQMSGSGFSIMTPMCQTQTQIQERISIMEEEDTDTDVDADADLDKSATFGKGEMGDLYISTTTKVVYLNQQVNKDVLFWKIPIVDYWRPVEGVIKKQMKVVSNTPQELEEIQRKLSAEKYFTETAVKTVNNTSARKMKYKDDRKITVGVSKKDIMNCRGKEKKAFMNCFAIIIRFKYEGQFREMHVKIFNTGKLEIPGILKPELLDIIKEKIVLVLQPHLENPVEFTEMENASSEGVLINSNFNCGFFINKEKLYTILRSEKYGIETTNDPCHYPGLKCKYYYNNELSSDDPMQTGQIQADDYKLRMIDLEHTTKYTKASFMIFRTGSCLILGNCSQDIITHIFQFVKRLLTDERAHIIASEDAPTIKQKNPKPRKRTIHVSNRYLTATK